MANHHSPLPGRPPFLWGVSTSAYQSEGGYNGAGQPQTNWAFFEKQGFVMATGRAAEFWSRYEEDFALCEAMGLNAFRLGVEWSGAGSSLVWMGGRDTWEVSLPPIPRVLRKQSRPRSISTLSIITWR